MKKLFELSAGVIAHVSYQLRDADPDFQKLQDLFIDLKLKPGGPETIIVKLQVSSIIFYNTQYSATAYTLNGEAARELVKIIQELEVPYTLPAYQYFVDNYDLPF